MRIPGEQLKKARYISGLSPEEVAEKIKTSLEQLKRWEDGKESPTLEEAYDLAELYGLPLGFVLEPTPEPAQRLDLRLERGFDSEEKQRGMLKATTQFEYWCQVAGKIEHLAGVSRPIRIQQIPSEAPAALAWEMRERFALSTSPVRNLRRLFEDQMGVLVFTFPIEGVSGMSWWHPLAGPAILLNRNDSHGRQNWTLVHELAHLLTSLHMFLCDTFAPNEVEEKERFANRFAAEFLIPSRDLSEYLPKKAAWRRLEEDEALSEIAKRYGVSREAIAWRLEGLGYLPRGFTLEQRSRWLRSREQISAQQQRRRGARRKRRVKELGKALVGRAIRAYRDGQFTLSKLAEELDLGIIEAEQLAKEWEEKPSVASGR